MALSTEAAAVNTKVDELIVVWKAYLDTLTIADRIYLIGTKDDLTHDDTSNPVFDVTGSHRRVEQWRGGYFWALGEGWPRDLFFKISDSAGALT